MSPCRLPCRQTAATLTRHRARSAQGTPSRKFQGQRSSDYLIEGGEICPRTAPDVTPAFSKGTGSKASVLRLPRVPAQGGERVVRVKMGAVV